MKRQKTQRKRCDDYSNKIDLPFERAVEGLVRVGPKRQAAKKRKKAMEKKRAK